MLLVLLRVYLTRVRHALQHIATCFSDSNKLHSAEASTWIESTQFNLTEGNGGREGKDTYLIYSNLI